ncbi:hypothetical protein [Winogradskya humida]|uniref:hypothetical protein n=1 Tax=Winogradskya humida TaxID=113566 RepID=UPI001944BE80|nr:hypothetical protein [Actinoplanes humidus]
MGYSDAAVQAQAKKIAKKIAKRKPRKYVIGVGLAILLSSGAGYAAVHLYG